MTERFSAAARFATDYMAYRKSAPAHLQFDGATLARNWLSEENGPLAKAIRSDIHETIAYESGGQRDPERSKFVNSAYAVRYDELIAAELARPAQSPMADGHATQDAAHLMPPEPAADDAEPPRQPEQEHHGSYGVAGASGGSILGTEHLYAAFGHAFAGLSSAVGDAQRIAKVGRPALMVMLHKDAGKPSPYVKSPQPRPSRWRNIAPNIS